MHTALQKEKPPLLVANPTHTHTRKRTCANVESGSDERECAARPQHGRTDSKHVYATGCDLLPISMTIRHVFSNGLHASLNLYGGLFKGRMKLFLCSRKKYVKIEIGELGPRSQGQTERVLACIVVSPSCLLCYSEAQRRLGFCACL